MTANSRMVRIEWGDCDPAGIIFYPRYYEIFDASTAALFERALGMTKFKSLSHYNFAGYPLVKTRAQFRKPTRYGDDVKVDTTIKFKTSSFEVEHKIFLGNEVAAEGYETRVWVVRDSADPGRIKSAPIPREVIERVSRLA